MNAKPFDALTNRLILFFACAASALGAFAALGSREWLAFAGIALGVLLAAWTLPETFLAPTLGALVIAQFYFPVPGASATLRGALVFGAALGVRIVLTRAARYRAWMVPAAVFLLAAFVAALGAPDRYGALKGIYDWLAVLLTAFVAGELIESRASLKRVVGVLIAVGVIEAALGLAQNALGLDRVIALLRAPISEIFFQPNLLRERLTDLSFNWIVFDRIVPFGNFINGIDYAIFLAVILSLALPLVIARRDAAKQSSLCDLGIASHPSTLPRTLAMTPTIILFAGILAMGAALLLTFKGSGLLAFAGGALTIAIFFLPRLSPRVFGVAVALALSALVFAAPFANSLSQRAVFLIQRETGALSDVGRLTIWAHLLAFLPQRPWFGFGLNGAILLTEQQPTLIGGAFAYTIPAAESAYIAALIETGIVGFGALMSLLGVIVARAWRNARESRDPIDIGVVAAIVALSLGNLTVAGFTTDQNGMLLGMLIGMSARRWRLDVGS